MNGLQLFKSLTALTTVEDGDWVQLYLAQYQRHWFIIETVLNKGGVIIHVSPLWGYRHAFPVKPSD